jgi:hypothetical protein
MALAALLEERGEPALIRSDREPKVIARPMRWWLKVCGVKTLYNERSSRGENDYTDSFIGYFADELLQTSY